MTWRIPTYEDTRQAVDRSEDGAMVGITLHQSSLIFLFGFVLAMLVRVRQ